MTKRNKEANAFYLAWAQLLERYGLQIASLLTILSLLLGWKVFQHVDKEGIPLDFTPQSIFLDDGEMVHNVFVSLKKSSDVKTTIFSSY